MRSSSALLGLTATLLSASAAEPPASVVEAWFKQTHVSIHSSSRASGDSGDIDYEFAPNGELRIAIAFTQPGKSVKGTLMLVSGVLLVRDLPLKPGEEIDAIDGPVLELQLVDKLLAIATGSPPDQLRGKTLVDLTEKSASIHVATPSAEGEYPAPWTLRGTIEALPAGVISFDLTHTFVLEGEKQSARFSGRWENAATPVKFDDAMALAGWQVFNLGPISRAHNGSAIYDYGASKPDTQYKTLGELRKAMAKKAH